MPQTNKQYGHPDFYKLLNEMGELHSRKNHDYAGTSDPLKNLRACTRLELDPFIGVMVRLQDKWSRIEEFVKSKTLFVKNESVEDTLMDNAVYSLLAIILLREQKKTTEAESVKDAAVIEESINKDAVVIEESISLIDSPRFKKGDKVRITLRNEAPPWMIEASKTANHKGVYDSDKGVLPYDYNVQLNTGRVLCLYNDEITLLEDN